MTQDFFLLLAAPFSYLPRPIHVISVFFISALYHGTSTTLSHTPSPSGPTSASSSDPA